MGSMDNLPFKLQLAHASDLRSLLESQVPVCFVGISPFDESDFRVEVRSGLTPLDGIVERRKTGPNFNPEVGFIERGDSNETYGDLTFKERPEIRGMRELQFEGEIIHAPHTRNEVSTQDWLS